MTSELKNLSAETQTEQKQSEIVIGFSTDGTEQLSVQSMEPDYG